MWSSDREIPDLVSLTEAAELLGVSTAAVRKRANKGTLPGAQVGNGWIFRREVIQAEVAAKSD